MIVLMEYQMISSFTENILNKQSLASDLLLGYSVAHES